MADADPTKSPKRKRDENLAAADMPGQGRASGRDPSNYPRKRVSIACEICRVRKTRCDAAKPSCSFCSQLGVECTYRKPVLGDRPEQEDKNEYWPRIANQLDRIEALLSRSRRDPGLIAPPVAQHQPPPSRIGSSSNTVSPNFGGEAEFIPPRRPSVLPLEPAKHGMERTSLPLVGAPMLGLSRLAGHPTPPVLEAMVFDDSEAFLEREMSQGEILFSAEFAEDLDLSQRTTWRLQRTFARDILPWIPLFDQEECVRVVNLAFSHGFDQSSSLTSLTFLIFALGAIAGADHDTDDNIHEFPGAQYFVTACRALGLHPAWHRDVVALQCRILQSAFFMFCLRPLQAWIAISEASRDVLNLLHLKRRMSEEVHFREACHRAYWACYLIEYELKGHMCYSTPAIHLLHESIPLPLSDHEEPGIYWMLSEIALRRIFANVSDTLGLYAQTTYAPVVASELRQQLSQWYSGLPSAIKFPLGSDPILDPRKAFLRAQYYSALCIVHWSFIVRLLTEVPQDPTERDQMVEEGRKCLSYAVLYAHAIESSMLHRHVMLFANMVGLYGQTLILISTSNLHLTHPSLHHLRVPSTEEAIHKALYMFEIWKDNPSIAATVGRLRVLVDAAGISSPYSTPDVVRHNCGGGLVESSPLAGDSGSPGSGAVSVTRIGLRGQRTWGGGYAG